MMTVWFCQRLNNQRAVMEESPSLPPPMVFAPNTILAQRYHLQERLGRTALGRQTWLALDRSSNERVIIKLLAFNVQMEWDELKLFEREAQVLASLTHPRIPRYRDYFSLDKNEGEGISWFVLVQDYIIGASLSDRLEKGQCFTETEVKSIAQESLEILLYLHELSPPVLHRDIKPSNLILGTDNHVYLVDFGAVQFRGAVTGVTFTVVGTSGYAPLEQFWGRSVPSSDLYGLGATLIHLLTGIAPIDLPHRDSKIQFSDRVSLPGDFQGWLEIITDTAVEKRFSSAREALESLKQGHLQRYSKAVNTYKLPKPTRSLIQLKKRNHKLEIDLPAKISFIRTFGTIMLWSLLGISLIGLVFSPIILLIVAIIFFVGLRNTQIEFTLDEVFIQYKIFNFIYKKITFKLQDLLGVFLHSDGKEGNYQIRLRTLQSHYLIGDSLRENECLWLGQEIQDWINLSRFR